MKMRATFQYLFPLLLEMAELCLSIPVSSAWPERGASCVKRVKTRVRSRLKNDMLESLLHISINGPEVKDSTALIDSTLKQWLAKPRRKMSIANKRPSNAEGRAHCVDVSIQVGSSDTVNVHDQEMEDESLCEQEEFEDNAGMMGTEEEVDAAANLFKLPAVDLEEYDTDSDVEDSTDSDYDSSDSD